MLRAIRSSPPGLAEDGRRRGVFVAALEQSEQLFKAAAAVGVETRPILLFYGLSQAGRAIAAAGCKGSDWKLETHGITTGNLADAAGGLASVTVRNGRSPKVEAFPTVARVIGSASLPHQTALGALWPLLPETERFPLPGASAHPVLVAAGADPYVPPVESVMLRVKGLPRELASPSKPDRGGNGWREERDRVTRFLRDYPSLAGYRYMAPEGAPCLQPTGTGCVVSLVYDRSDGGRDDPDAELRARTIDYGSSRYIFPSIDGSAEPLHPLGVWWALLFALSMLARYDPEQWARVTDINISRDAAAVEFLLDEAFVALPEAIHCCLTGLPASGLVTSRG